MDRGRWSYARILGASVILVGVYFLAQGAARLANLWILIFGSVVVAVIVSSIADPLVNRLKLKDGIAVFVAILTVLLLLAGVGVLFGRQVSSQVHQLNTNLPAAWEQFQARIENSPIAGWLMGRLQSFGSESSRALGVAPRIAMSTATGAATLVLVVVAGIFLASQPEEAREGALSMAPKSVRGRLREVMNACGRALKGWLKAQLLSMLLVGSLVSLGLWTIGVPAPLALGLVTGLAQFVPIVGPIASAVPALLVAATDGTQALLLTLGLYVGVSQLEANLITPLVQKNVASLPVVLGIFAVVALGTLCGPLGVLFATPLTLVLYTSVTMLYRQDVLHDENATAPGAEPPG